MSGFGIGINNNAPDEGRIKGTSIEIACACWYTSKGVATPFMIKYIDDNGEVQSIKDIKVNYMENKNYSGIPSLEYDCRLVCQSTFINAKLLFLKNENIWKLILK